MPIFYFSFNLANKTQKAGKMFEFWYLEVSLSILKSKVNAASSVDYYI